MAAAEFADVTIRLATPDDAAMLAKLRFDLRASLHELREDEAAFVERCASWMRERLRPERVERDDRWRCWIAERDGAMVGSVWVQLIEKIPNPIAALESYVYLTNFYGSHLLEAAVSWSRSNNAERVLLWPTERSKTLYERHGFLPADDFMELML